MAGRIEDQLSYDPITGIFTWKINKRKVKAGDRAGCVDSGRYRYIKINYQKIAEHRLAVYLMTGEWPIDEVDHINHDGLDNRWCNLRECTKAQNQVNRRPRCKAGHIGVFEIRGKYRATGYKSKYLGQYETPEEAARIALSHRKGIFGEFAYGT